MKRNKRHIIFKHKINHKVIVLTCTLMTIVLSGCTSQENSSLNLSSNENSSFIDNSSNEDSSSFVDKDSSVSNESSKQDSVEDSSKVEKPVINVGKINDSYFEDVVFIGDSRTEGLELYNLIPNATFYTSKGLMVNTIFTTNAVKINNKYVTIIDALKVKKFGKIYIMLGVNELGWAYDSIYYEKYGKLIDEIKKIQPDAEIILQSLLPVSKEKSDKDKIYNNTNIVKYNNLIKQLSEEKKIVFIDSYQAVVDKAGVLPEYASTDGVHLTKDYCYLWAKYLQDNKK